VLKQREDLLGTTSSSPLVYATLDGWRRQMVEHDEQPLSAAVARSRRMFDAVQQLPGLSPMGREVVRPGGASTCGGSASAASRPGMAARQLPRRRRLHGLLRSSSKITYADDDETKQRPHDALPSSPPPSRCP